MSSLYPASWSDMSQNLEPDLGIKWSVILPMCKDRSVIDSIIHINFCLGMDDVSLLTFMRQNTRILNIVFPTEFNRSIVASEVLNAMTFENRNDNETNTHTAENFIRYINDGTFHLVQILILS